MLGAMDLQSSMRHPGHCHADCSSGAGSSRKGLPLQSVSAPPVEFLADLSERKIEGRHRMRTRRKRHVSAATTLAFGVMLWGSSAAPSCGAQDFDMKTESTMSKLIKKRQDLVRRQGVSGVTPFNIGVTPPTTCEQMNVTFSTRGGTPPYTILIGFDNWFGYEVSLPASYADADVDTWMYPFNVPLFNLNVAGSNPNPTNFVAVGDSTGKLLNTSSFQTVTVNGNTCDSVSGKIDFYFYTDPDLVVCQNLGLYWSPMNDSTPWTDPLNAYMIPEQEPPMHIPITNSSARSQNITLAIQPGKKVMFHMTDKGGQGGVSGVNVAGGSEYVSQDCLTQSAQYAFALPTATTTLSNARMPDFTATISATVTGADGSLSTTTSVEEVHRGSIVGPNLGTGEIAGLSVGVAIAAALMAALTTWYIWRRRHGRGIVFWDLPTDADGELSKSHINGPIDRNFLKEHGKHREHSSNSSSSAPILALSPTSESSEERERRRTGRMQVHDGRPYASDASLPSSQYHQINIDSPTDEHQHSFSTPAGARPEFSSARRVSSASSTSNPFVDNQPSHSRSQRQRFADIAESDSNLSPSGPYSSAASYGAAMSRGMSTDDGMSEALPMIETSYHSSTQGVRSYRRARQSQGDPFTASDDSRGVGAPRSRGSASASGPGSGTYTSIGTGTDTNASRRMPEYVRHSDAGLLMDDSLEHEDASGRIELPPQYHDVPSSRARTSTTIASRDGIAGHATGAGTASFGPFEARAAADGDLGGHSLLTSGLDRAASGVNAEGDEDESEFWRDA